MCNNNKQKQIKMKTLEVRSSKTIEATSIKVENFLGREEVIYFYISETYNTYTDGTEELWKTSFVKNDQRDYANQSEQFRVYPNEKSYRNAIKRWSKKSIRIEEVK